MSAARRVAAALRARRDRPGGDRGTVLDLDPLRVDLHGSDLVLGARHVRLGRLVAAADVAVGDVLVLVAVQDGRWIAVDMEDDPDG